MTERITTKPAEPVAPKPADIDYEAERARLLELHDRDIRLLEQEILLDYKLGKRKPPRAIAAPRGNINTLLHMAATKFEKSHPTKLTRWVLSPITNSIRSKVLQRKMEGYVPVTVNELGIEDAEMIFGPGESTVRVMDVTLMQMDKKKKEGRDAILAKKADEAARRSEIVYEQGKEDKVHGVKRIGSVKRGVEYLDMERIPAKGRREE